jgi:hypothetical protein
VPGAGDLLHTCVGDVVGHVPHAGGQERLVSDPCSTSTGAEITLSTAGSSGMGPWYSLNCWKKLRRFGT